MWSDLGKSAYALFMLVCVRVGVWGARGRGGGGEREEEWSNLGKYALFMLVCVHVGVWGA